jgi:3-deoxy-D-manno-octulosonic-acid transferase
MTFYFTYTLTLGADTARCKVSKNVKFDISVNKTVKDKQLGLAGFVDDGRLILVVVSMHKGDEKIALTAFTSRFKKSPKLLLIIVPRHPKGFNEVARLYFHYGFFITRRSTQEKVTSDKKFGYLIP